jgi:hypothetical protein
VQHKQPGRIPAVKRLLRYQFLGQGIVEVRDFQHITCDEIRPRWSLYFDSLYPSARRFRSRRHRATTILTASSPGDDAALIRPGELKS